MAIRGQSPHVTYPRFQSDFTTTKPANNGTSAEKPTLESLQLVPEEGLFQVRAPSDTDGNGFHLIASLWERETEAAAREDGAMAELQARFRSEYIPRWIDQLQ